MSVVSMVVGAVTDTGARVVAKVDGGGPVRVAVSTSADMSAASYHGPASVDGQGVATVQLSGLAPDTRYWWQVEDNGTLDTAYTGQLVTDPPLGLPASYTLGVIGDAGLNPEAPGVAGAAPNRLSNHPVFDIVRERGLADGWRRLVHLGDICYYDLGSGSHGLDPAASLDQYRGMWDDILAQPRQHKLYHSLPWVYQWDDHDYGPNDSDSTAPGRDNACLAYRERVPSYPLPAGPGAQPTYHAFEIGRVLHIVSDTRSARVDGVTMLGAAQVAWLEHVLTASTARALIWLMPTPWLGGHADTWDSYAAEQQTLVELVRDTGWAQRMVMVSADVHALGLAHRSEVAVARGGWPHLLCASIDATPSAANGHQYDLGWQPGRGQYGTVHVADTGSHIVITLAGWQGATLWRSYQYGIAVPQPRPAGGALTRTLAGSHRVVVEARVVSGHPTGDDPDGVALPVLGGDVLLDGTAQVRGTLALETQGWTEDGTGRPGGRTLFPRRAGDLLAPFGAEIYVRYGVDLGGAGVLWAPLGYYRIDTVEQTNAPDGPLRIAGSDRMAGLVDGRLASPVVFPASRTVAQVVADLVQEIYPAAVIIWDDDAGSEPLGRDLLVEDDRYGAVHELVTSLGKIAYWDGAGFLRIETAPDSSVPVWEVAAGRHGVLVEARRAVSRVGVPNGFVVTGQGGDQTSNTRAVAVDASATSPTRWGGPFGRVPAFYSSPFITNPGRALVVATQMLRRRLGLPYTVSFGAVTNPTLKPYDPIRITYRDGSRELHVMETVTIPLGPGAMSGTTREQTLVQIGAL